MGGISRGTVKKQEQGDADIATAPFFTGSSASIVVQCPTAIRCHCLTLETSRCGTSSWLRILQRFSKFYIILPLKLNARAWKTLQLRLWERGSGMQLRTLSPHRASAIDVCISTLLYRTDAFKNRLSTHLWTLAPMMASTQGASQVARQLLSLIRWAKWRTERLKAYWFFERSNTSILQKPTYCYMHLIAVLGSGDRSV
jgi:hypothetical protein